MRCVKFYSWAALTAARSAEAQICDMITVSLRQPQMVDHLKKLKLPINNNPFDFTCSPTQIPHADDPTARINPSNTRRSAESVNFGPKKKSCDDLHMACVSALIRNSSKASK